MDELGRCSRASSGTGTRPHRALGALGIGGSGGAGGCAGARKGEDERDQENAGTFHRGSTVGGPLANRVLASRVNVPEIRPGKPTDHGSTTE